MLSDHPVYTTLPTPDLDGLRRFYEDVLGFVPREASPAGVYYDAGDGTYFTVTRSSGKASGDHTQMGFRINDIDSEVADLRRRRVVFRITSRQRPSTASRRSRSARRRGSRTRMGT